MKRKRERQENGVSYEQSPNQMLFSICKTKGERKESDPSDATDHPIGGG